MDPHILIEFLVEDDCSWNPMGSGGISTAWIQDLEQVLDGTKKYLKKYAIIEDDGLGYRASYMGLEYAGDEVDAQDENG